MTSPDFSELARSPYIDWIKTVLHTHPGSFRMSKSSFRINAFEWSLEGEPISWTVTLHNPTVKSIQVLLDRYPDAPAYEIQVGIDLRPKRNVPPARLDEVLKGAYEWLVKSLYPWSGDGMQTAWRASWGLKKSRNPYGGDVDSPIEAYEGLYLGHSDRALSDPARPNFASVYLYPKRGDYKDGSHVGLPKAKHSARVEVTLAREGCEHFNLLKIKDVFGFNFRRLSPYFWMTTPTITALSFNRLKSKNPALAVLLSARMFHKAVSDAQQFGAFVLGSSRMPVKVKRRPITQANRMMGTALDNLTKMYRKP